MKEKIIKIIVSELKNKHKNKTKLNKELKILAAFIKKSNYFTGRRRKLYSIIINAKKYK